MRRLTPLRGCGMDPADITRPTPGGRQDTALGSATGTNASGREPMDHLGPDSHLELHHVRKSSSPVLMRRR